MRLPIKFNTGHLPVFLQDILPNKWSPAELVQSTATLSRVWFSLHISGLMQGRTWKSTTPGRHIETDRLILGLRTEERRYILDIGVSDGITSLELIEKLAGRFKTFFVTDICLNILCARRGRQVFFYDQSQKCICAAGKWLVVYPQGSETGLIHRLARYLARHADRIASLETFQFSLIQPDLMALARKDSRIVCREYDVFRPWDGPAMDVIKVANLLNTTYFSREQLTTAIKHLHAALSEGGRLVVTDNRLQQAERATMFRRVGDTFDVESSINGGCEASPLVTGFPANFQTHSDVQIR